MIDNENFDNRPVSLVRRVVGSQLLYSVIVGLCVLAMWLIDYCGGRWGKHLIGVLPLMMLPFFLAIIFSIVVLVRAVWSIVRRQKIFYSIIIVFLTVGFWLAPQIGIHRPFMIGFRHRVLSMSSPEELREIAAKACEVIAEDECLPAPGKWSHYNEDDHAVLWNEMGTYDIFSSDTNFVVIYRLQENIVELSWGGALVGHWGVRIAEETVSRKERDHEFVLLENDICLFYSD